MLRANRRLSQKRQAILTHRGCLHWKRQEHGWYGSHPMSDRQKRKRKSDCLCKQTFSNETYEEPTFQTFKGPFPESTAVPISSPDPDLIELDPDQPEQESQV